MTAAAPPRRRPARTDCTLEERRAADALRAQAEERKRLLAIDHRRFAVLIQAMWRGYVARDALRSAQEQRAYLAVMFACMKIQRRFRNHLQLKAEREVLEREERQRMWAVWVVQSVARCAAPRAELRRRRAAREAAVRARLMEKAAVCVQKYWRGHLQRRLALWLREAAARRHLACVAPPEEEPQEPAAPAGAGAPGGEAGGDTDPAEAARRRRARHMAAACKARSQRGSRR